MSRTTQRVETSDTIVTVTTTVEEHSKFVDYDDIRAAVTIEPDDRHEAPWENCDGWDHQFDRGTIDHDDGRHDQTAAQARPRTASAHGGPAGDIRLHRRPAHGQER